MLLSIIIPSYNHEQFVLSTIQAAGKIDIRDKEIIVIDDGSTDSSVKVIREYIASCDSDTRIRFIARENRGLVRTLNEGLALAEGKYLYGVASDDIPIPEGIRSLIDILEAKDTLQFVLGNGLFMDSEQQREFKPIYGEAHKRFFALPWSRRRRELFLQYPQPILLQATVFRRSALTAIGGWREDITLDDMALFLRLFSRFTSLGSEFGFHPEIMACFYRQHQTNVSKNVRRQFIMVEQALTRLCPPELLKAALLRNLIAHGLTALDTGNPNLVPEFVASTMARVGFLPMSRAVASESWDTLKNGFTRYRAHTAKSTVVHESAAAKDLGELRRPLDKSA